MQGYLLFLALAACISSGFTFKLTPTHGRSYSESVSVNAESSDRRQHCRSMCSSVRTRLKRDYCILECELLPSARQTIPEHITRCVADRCSDLDATGYHRQTFSERYVTCVTEKCLYAHDHGVEKLSAAVGAVRVVPSKRSWSDLAATCIEYNCPYDRPGSLQYTMCVQTNCNAEFIKR
ncbi:hypothetical protein LSAT2_006563 [Lamellibrachia satsuma]|nr:hypothetical protein LSAT2_006563 [Lamellibrachia satsuma]